MSIILSKVGSASSTTASEIPAFDPASKRLFVVAASKVNVYSVSNTGALTAATDLVVGFAAPAGTTPAPNSVAVKNGIVAVAYEIRASTTPFTNQRGQVSFYRASDGAFLSSVEVGFLPDMLTFTPDGTKVLVANEGEPNLNYTIDPEGSVSVISINSVNLTAGTLSATVQEAGFTSFNAQFNQLKSDGVRLIGPTGTTVAKDVEPEYIAVSADGLTAAITLQENNAIAMLDIATATITSIKSLGLKNFNLSGNGIDASDRDGTPSGSKINIQNWPVFGAYQPDAIASYTANGQTFYIIANEGDARDARGAFTEETRLSATTYTLDTTVFPNAATLKLDQNLGRLNVSNKSGDTDDDGDFDQIVAFGGRSFSILDANGNMVFDSGDQLEQITARFAPTIFNSDGLATNFDTRSDNKGPEPEGVAIGVINGRTYAFIGLERVGDVIVYDVTNPISPIFVQYLNQPEDRGIEGLIFVSAVDSPTGKPLVITANETSNTVSVFESTLFERSNILQPSTGVINLTGNIGTINQLSFNIVSVNTNATVNELVAFEVDGTTPNLKQLLETGKGRVISSLVSNRPNGFVNEGKIIDFDSNSRIGFALIRNGTADQILAGQSREVVFSTTTPNFISSVTSNSFKITFEGLVVDVATSNSVRPIGVGLQGNKQGEAIDLRGIVGKVNVNFTVNREAAFNNFVGFYRVADVNGGIDIDNNGVIDFKPGDSGYTRAAVQNRIAGIDLSVSNQGTAAFNGRELTGGSIFAPFIISNASVDDVLASRTSQVYFAYLGANSDGVDHIRLLGDNTFGFEDLAGGGDFDYNDIIVKVKLS